MRRCVDCGGTHAAKDWICPACGASPRLEGGLLRFVRAGLPPPTHDADYLVLDLAAAEKWHFWFQSRQRLVLWALRRYFPHARRLLDLGCGTGFMLERVHGERPEMELCGCDPHVESLTVAAARLRTAFLFQATVDTVPFEDEFDVISALDVIEHIDDDQHALAAVRRAVRPGGGVIITVPQHPWLWSPVDTFSCHRRRYTRGDLETKVRQSGFEIIRSTSFFTATLPLMALSRWRRAPFDPAAEFRIPRPVNALLDAVMSIELGLLKLGLRLPAGGSLVVVARRPV